ncbi:MAG: hypothetical protein R3338_11025, partial [Thermoanaerobaculia bacterium]|nr:hypothetical protein [Thermoanaerobaculia bacterium]
TEPESVSPVEAPEPDPIETAPTEPEPVDTAPSETDATNTETAMETEPEPPTPTESEEPAPTEPAPTEPEPATDDDGGSNPPGNHTVDWEGVMHAPGAVSKCKVCHGKDLRGGRVELSCYDCHDDVWSD